MDSAARKNSLTPSESTRSNTKEIPGLLSTIGLVTIAYGLTALLFASLPLKLLDPGWQLRASGAFSASGPFLLIGTLLVCLAKSFEGTNKQLISRVRLLRNLSIWATILYLVLVPIQLHAGVRLLREQSSQEVQLQAQWGKFKAQLQASDTEDELRALLATLPQPVELPDNLNLPLATLKERLLIRVDSRFNALKYQTEQARSQRWQNFIAEAASNCIKTLLVAIGFAAFAQRRPGDPSLLDQGLSLIGQGRRRRGSSVERQRVAP